VLYANVVLGLPPDGPFDYLVPAELEDKVRVGLRVWVNFRNKKEVAYIVELSNKTKIKKIKEITSVIDLCPVLDEWMLLLTRKLAQYYCCSWGQAIEAALPEELRKGKKTSGKVSLGESKQDAVVSLEGAKANGTVSLEGNGPGFEGPRPLFVQGFDRMPVYLREIKKALELNKSVIVLTKNIPDVERMKEAIGKSFPVKVFSAFRKQSGEMENWEEIRQADFCVVAGTRSSIFSCPNNPGLIIIDQPEDQVYKQEQVPHYHAVWVAWMRAHIQGVKIILGSQSLSLENYYLWKEGNLDLETIPRKIPYPQIKVIDARRVAYAQGKNKPMFSKFLADAIQAVLSEKGKVLLVINRKGFATTAICHNCQAVLKCPRCNINLVFHFEEDKLKCHHCNFSMPVPKICPNCNAGYIQYFGSGVEKVESELARVFPQARIGQDILVDTGAVVACQKMDFDLIGIMEIDSWLNRVDFRASEKTFSMLTGIVCLTSKKLIIQSANINHYCFQALIKNDPEIFFKEELKQRKQLNFSPFRHMILLKIRGADPDKVKKDAQDLFQRLNKIKTNSMKMLSLNPGQPAKLRGNFYYQILMRALSVEKASHFLKLHLKDERFSGIIVTVDVDPV